MKVSAQDVHCAVEMIAERLEQMESRLRVGSGESLRHHPDVFVADRKASVLPLAINRGLEVGSLDRAGKIFDGAASGPLDSALDLASSLAHAPAPMAVAGGWSAVESLLSFPGDGEKVAAADRLSALVACSFPRAELTTLAHQYSACHTDALADTIRRVVSNREKARCLLEGITSNAALPFPEQSDRAAVDRVTLWRCASGSSDDASGRAVWARRRGGDQARIFWPSALPLWGTFGHGQKTASHAAAPRSRSFAHC